MCDNESLRLAYSYGIGRTKIIRRGVATMESVANDAKNNILPKAPRIWVGYLIAAIFLAGEIAQLPDWILLLIGFCGVAYWYFCIYRIHAALAEATRSAHPISPTKAVGYHFIPFFNLLWVFKWPRQIAEFVNSRSPRVKMPKYRAGFFILCGLVILKIDGAIGLCILFASTDRIIHRIDGVLPGFLPPHPSGAGLPHRWQRLRVAIAAGLGTSIGFIVFDALEDFINHDIHYKLQFIFVSAVMLLFAATFIEPLTHQIKIVLGYEAEGAEPAKPGAWNSAGAAITIIVLGMLYDLLHDTVEADPLKIIGILAFNLLICGGITNAWTSGAQRYKPNAALFGGISGLLLGSMTAIEGLPQQIILMSICIFAILGFSGGYAIDRGWGSHPSRTVATTIVVLMIPFVFPMVYLNVQEWLGDFARVTGWGLGLVLYPPANAILAAKSSAAIASSLN
ncbi:MAG: hypothetical protein ABSG46_15595 [Candidatus Binataceae bacterium]